MYAMLMFAHVTAVVHVTAAVHVTTVVHVTADVHNMLLCMSLSLILTWGQGTEPKSTPNKHNVHSWKNCGKIARPGLRSGVTDPTARCS